MDLYLCNTYYHLLISIIKTLKNKKKSDLMIFRDGDNDILINDKRLIDRIKKSDIFNNIYFFDYNSSSKYKNKLLEVLKRNSLGNRIIKNNIYDFKKYENIYIFNIYVLPIYLLDKQKINYILLEDGTDSLKNNIHLVHRDRSKMKTIIRKFFYLYEIGESKYMKAVEVNNKEGITYINDKKIIECNKSDLFESLTSEERKIILNIFNYNVKNIDKDISLILTQPMNEDGHLANENEKILIYKRIIRKYVKDNNFIIKVHPREKTDYTKYFDKEKIISDKFPIEILNFVNGIKIKKIITVSSTAINLLSICNDKIFLGWDYLEKFKEELQDEK